MKSEDNNFTQDSQFDSDDDDFQPFGSSSKVYLSYNE